MKVFMYSRGYPTDRYKMNGIFEMDQALALKEKGLDVVFISVDLRSIRRKRKFGIHNFVKDGIKMYTIDVPVGNIPRGIFYKIGIWAFKKIFKIAVENEGRPDIVHTFFTHQGYIMTKSLKDTDIKLVLTEANSHINKEKIEPSLESAARYSYEHVDRLITVSPDFEKKIERKFGQKSDVVTVIPELDIFSYDGPTESEDDIFRFVSTGRITKAKGMEDLVRSFILAFDKGDRVRLDIFGDGADRVSLEELVAKEGYQDMIKFWGMTDRKDIAENYKKADAFVMLSHSETFGLAYLEALASGLPIIASRCGGPEHLVFEENGILVDVGDIEGQARALVYMKENIASYNKEEISHWAKTEYSRENITDDLVKIYKELADD